MLQIRNSTRRIGNKYYLEFLLGFQYLIIHISFRIAHAFFDLVNRQIWWIRLLKLLAKQYQRDAIL